MEKDKEIKLETREDILRARIKIDELEKRFYRAVERYIKRLENKS